MKQNQELKKLKVFTLKQLIRMRREQKEFIRGFKKETSMDEVLTVKEVAEQFKISSKTIYRWKNKGLDVNQRVYKGKITIRRSDLENYIKKERYGRFK